MNFSKTLKSRYSSTFIFLFSISIIHFVYFIYQASHCNYFLTDSHEYLSCAKNLMSHFTLYCGDLNLPLEYDFFTKRPPIYPLFLALCTSVINHLMFVILIQNILSITGIFLVRKLLINFGYTSKYDLLFILLLVVTPSQFIYANLIMSEILLQFLFISLIWTFYQFITKQHLLYGIAYGIVLTLCILTKPVFVYLAFINLGFLVWFFYKKFSYQYAILGMLPIIVLLSYQYRNYRHTGVFEMSSIVTINLVDYNTYFFLVKTTGYDAADKSISKIDSLAALTTSYKDKVALQKKLASEILLNEPFQYATFHLKGIIGFFFDPGRFDLVNFFNLKTANEDGLLMQINKIGLWNAILALFKNSFLFFFILTLIGIFNLLKFIGFVLYLKNYKEIPMVMWLFVFVLFYVAGLTGPLGASRFMMPFVPLFIGCGLHYMVIRNKNGQNQKRMAKWLNTRREWTTL